ncbi:MAG: hypothetical protein HN368_24325, partial [Spirochaetales bacterium]|nr:hypothetical protein [Spirochaetales bacterium]
MKIVVIGAGSSTFGRRTVTDVLCNTSLGSAGVELVLVDTDPQRLGSIHKLSTMLKKNLESSTVVTATTQREEALPGADYVLISVTQQRYELWEQDFRVPYAYGFKQAYGENGGPGALFHALRNIHVILSIAKDIERTCPSAFVLNFSNPESRVLYALSTLTELNSIGLCHGQHDALQAICQMLKKTEDDIDITGGGINHLFWLHEIKERKTGKDLYPSLREAAAKNKNQEFTLPKKLLEIYGMLTYPDNTHAGEYFSFGAEYMKNKWVHGLESRGINDGHKSEIDLLAPYINGEKPLSEISISSREVVIPMIVAHSKNARARFISANVMNEGLYVPNVMADGIIEVPVEVDGSGVHPQTIPALPEGVAAFVRTQMAIQKLT